jgi:hypothetical protein
VEAGDFDFRGFEVARSQLFDSSDKPYVFFSHQKMNFSVNCVRKFGPLTTVEILINTIKRIIAVRPTDKTNRNGIVFSKSTELVYQPRMIATAAFSETLFSIMGGNVKNRYRILG